MTLGFEEVKKDVHRRSVPKMVLQDGKRPHECPTVGVQLGKGHIYLRQERPFETREW